MKELAAALAAPSAGVAPGGVPLTVDIYQPMRGGPYPAIVQIYGGAWQRGVPGNHAPFAARLAASGLGPQQQALLDLTARAQEKIDKIDRIKDLVDLAAELLGMLLDSLVVDRQIIQDARANDAHEVLLQRVHRLHGATRYCGVPQLRAACQHCETLLKQKSPASAAALDDLDAAIEQLLEETGQTNSVL